MRPIAKALIMVTDFSYGKAHMFRSSKILKPDIPAKTPNTKRRFSRINEAGASSSAVALLLC